MNDNVLGIFFDYNIVLDSRTNRHHLVGICKTGSLSYALIITGPVMYISHEQNSIRTSEGIYYLESAEKQDFYQKLVSAIPPSFIENGRFISNCSLLFH